MQYLQTICDNQIENYYAKKYERFYTIVIIIGQKTRGIKGMNTTITKRFKT